MEPKSETPKTQKKDTNKVFSDKKFIKIPYTTGKMKNGTTK